MHLSLKDLMLCIAIGMMSLMSCGIMTLTTPHDQANKSTITDHPHESTIDLNEDQSLPPLIATFNSNTFYLNKNIGIGIYEVTQKEYEALIENNPSEHKGCPNCPVENISYNDALNYINKLNILSNPHSLRYRLPTEVEWEQFATANKEYIYPGGDILDSIAVYINCPQLGTVPVTSTASNDYDIHGMAGNVAEWTSTPYMSTKKRDEGKYIVKGGSYYSHEEELQITTHQGAYADKGISTVGLRLICEKI